MLLPYFELQVEPSDSVYYRFLYMTTTMEKVVGCSNRFHIRLMMSLPMSQPAAVTNKPRRRSKGLDTHADNNN